jgi:hypothetical protein
VWLKLEVYYFVEKRVDRAVSGLVRLLEWMNYEGLFSLHLLALPSSTHWFIFWLVL